MKKKIVIFSGAGLSQESGVPTFRDSNGLWHNHKVEDVAAPEGWKRDPQMVLNFYAERHANMNGCEPNAAHHAIASLEEKYDVTNITQNIDDFLERAGCKTGYHLHGSINARKCEWHKDISTLDGDTQFACNYKENHTSPVKLGEKCPKCGGQLRPDVVWFGEAVHIDYNGLKGICGEMKENDGTFICIGTSGLVYPAAYLISFFSQVPHRYIVDPKPVSVSNYTRLCGTAGTLMPDLAASLLKEEHISSNIDIQQKDNLDDLKDWLSQESD